MTAMTGRTPAACPRAAGSAGAARIGESTKGAGTGLIMPLETKCIPGAYLRKL